MGLRVEPARSDEERARVYGFRYRVYVEEMRIETPEADHDAHELRDPLDAWSTSWTLLRDERVLGTLRVTRVADVPDPDLEALVTRFAMERALDRFGAGTLCTSSRFMIHPELRRGRGILRLMAAVYEDSRRRGIRLNYGDCSPHLLPFYEHLGFRRYGDAFNDTAYGFKVPILMLLGDREHFHLVRSPLRRIADRFDADPEAQAWFAAAYPEQRTVQSATLLEDGAFLDLLANRLAGDPLHHLGLLRGLERDEADRFLARATLVKAAAGDRLVRQGETGDSLFVLLSGVAEVVDEARPNDPLDVLGAGDAFGEMAFLNAAPRTASVTARAPCEAVVLSGDWLDRFLRKEPAVAAKLLLNLSRMLARRLTEANRRNAAVGT